VVYLSGISLSLRYLRDFPIHKQDPKTPPDVFFGSFLLFGHDPSFPLRRGDAESDDA
jgi:hypothetical protein